MLGIFLATYPGTTELSYFLQNGERQSVSAATGVTQGCVLGSILFALGTHPIIVEALDHRTTNNVHAYSIADDTNLAGTPEQTTAAALRLQQLLHSKADLHVKKWDVLLGPDCRDITADELKDAGLNGEIRIIKTADGGGADVGQHRTEDKGVRLLGAPTGHADYAKTFVADLVDKHAERLEHIEKLATFIDDDTGRATSRKHCSSCGSAPALASCSSSRSCPTSSLPTNSIDPTRTSATPSAKSPTSPTTSATPTTSRTDASPCPSGSAARA